MAIAASTADHFYVGWTAKVFNATDTSFETRLRTAYEGSNLTATLASPLSYGQADGKPYAVEGARAQMRIQTLAACTSIYSIYATLASRVGHRWPSESERERGGRQRERARERESAGGGRG